MANDEDKKYIFEDDNDDNDIMEYLERDLEVPSRRVKSRVSARTGGTRVSAARGVSGENAYEKNKVLILWGALGVLIIILMIALILTNVNTDKSQNETDTGEQITTGEALEEPTTEDEDVLLAEPVDSEYNVLFEKYYYNSFVEWDEAVLSECYDNMQNVSEENYTYLNKYIEKIQDIICYVGYETDDGKELVYVTYNMKFKNIETTAPAMDTFLLVKTENGYRLHNFDVGEELEVYTNKIKENKQFLELKSNINNQLGIALESNADLKKVYNALKNVSSGED